MVRILFWLVLFIPIIGYSETIITDSTSDSTVESNINSNTKVTSPPPSAIAPSFITSNSDLCTVGTSASIQTQIFGISGGTVFTEKDCTIIKQSRLLYSYGLKVSAISLLCGSSKADYGSRNIHIAMQNAGTPCPVYDPIKKRSLIGEEAQEFWDNNPHLLPDAEVVEKKEEWNESDKTTVQAVGGMGALFALLLFLM